MAILLSPALRTLVVWPIMFIVRPLLKATGLSRFDRYLYSIWPSTKNYVPGAPTLAFFLVFILLGCSLGIEGEKYI